MSMSFGSSSKKGSSSQKTNPWEPTIPGLQSLISDITGYSKTGVGPTSDQLDAFEQLKANAGEGNPFEEQIGQLSADLFGADSRSGEVESAYADLSRRLGGVADGENLDVNENPYLQDMMQTVGDDIFKRIGSQFAGAGRDITGNAAGLKAMGRGITEGQLPTLFNQYNLERANQSDAAKTLFSGGTNAASTAQGLDQASLGQRMQGVSAAQAFMDARDQGANTILNLEEQMKDMPAEDLANYVSLLGSIAGLGGQSKGTTTQKGTAMGLGVSDAIGGLGSVFKLLSDERAKEGTDGGEPEKVGSLADGTAIYRYRYKGDPKGTPQIGVMAQEVEQHSPDAVTEVGGVKFVDYDKATDKAAKKLKKRG